MTPTQNWFSRHLGKEVSPMPLVQVTMVAGRSAEQKHALIARVSAAVAETLGTPIERVRVAIYEVSPDEWGIGGVPYAVARRPAGETTS
jgi:4-oxalocrotonate tautomerase